VDKSNNHQIPFLRQPKILFLFSNATKLKVTFDALKLFYLLKDKINNESHKGWEGSPFHQQLEAKKLKSKQKSKKVDN
jgi:hypothetical protein